ncbi:amidohydrolase family protein [Gracilibacillus salitolerans]|uniref:Amidohydrolase family protein n=1 Tax=Gracilibacillus salitolerans TaxID=2663022 RepID=A0A5Q2TK64_9BACI|nr:amidohydrolase [Gracilibacillus salitolerans]QGH35324.1 amidohydrolase family protein [Gracilibacillus salitolerans]
MGTLFYGGTIYTMEDEASKAEAVYVEEGTIMDIGKESVLRNTFMDRIDEEYNMDGATMYPGFVDSHLHIIGHGEKLLHLDLSSMQSANEVLRALGRKVNELEPEEWLIADGWNENLWEDARIIDKNELDNISNGHPIILSRICRHAIIVNSKVLELAGITSQTEDPQGGKIIRYQSGEPTGYLLDQAQELVKEIMPPISESKLQETVKASIEDLLRLGLVGGHSEDLSYYGGFERTFRAYHKILPEKYKFRAHLLVHHLVFDEMLDQGLQYGDGGKFTTLGAMKIFSDGALGGRTAWLSESYHDDPNNAGIPIHKRHNLEILFQKARKFQHPVAVHAIGDKAVEEIVACIEKYPLKNDLKDRIIHAQIMNAQLLDRLKKIPVVLDIQPSFVASDFPWVKDRLGDRRTKEAYPWKTYLNNGIACAAGSDAPIEEVNPLLGIQAAVTRRSNMDGQIYGSHQRLSVFEAISLYTKGSAYVINHAHDRGMIKPGFVADFTILEKDVFKHDPDLFHEIEVKATIVDGQIMYEKPEA